MTAPDVRSAVERIVYGYADRVDAGDFAGLAELFRDATYKGGGPDDPGVVGTDAVLAIQEQMIRRYADGTPRTKHVTTNLVIDADEAAGTATAPLVLHRPPAGRRPSPRDRHRRPLPRPVRVPRRDVAPHRAGRSYCDLIGDLSRHLTVDPFRA